MTRHVGFGRAAADLARLPAQGLRAPARDLLPRCLWRTPPHPPSRASLPASSSTPRSGCSTSSAAERSGHLRSRRAAHRRRGHLLMGLEDGTELVGFMKLAGEPCTYSTTGWTSSSSIESYVIPERRGLRGRFYLIHGRTMSNCASAAFSAASPWCAPTTWSCSAPHPGSATATSERRVRVGVRAEDPAAASGAVGGRCGARRLRARGELSPSRQYRSTCSSPRRFRLVLAEPVPGRASPYPRSWSRTGTRGCPAARGGSQRGRSGSLPHRS